MTQTPPLLYVAASKLSIAPTNVRKRTDPIEDAELRATILVRGIIQNLVGIPVARKKGEYQITAGGRRLTQVQALIAEGQLPDNYQVPVMVLADRSGATEVSLIENFTRANMTPAEECRAFQAIIADGKKTPADVAKCFGLTERFVLGRLRLANLADIVFDALADGAITLDVAKAYGSISDTARQAAVFEELQSSYYEGNSGEIRRRLVSGVYRGNDPKAVLVGREDYLAAGGRIESDLFSDRENENWIDSEIIDRLAEQRMEAAAEALRAREGFGELRVLCQTRVPYMDTMALDEVEGVPLPLSQEEENRQRAIEVELESIADNADGDGYTDEEIERIEALEAEHASLDDRPAELDAQQKAGSIAYLVIGEDGVPRLHNQFFAIPQESGEDETDVEAGEGAVPEEASAEEAVPRSSISQRLGDELAMMKTEVLRVHVASDPHFALDLGTFIMVDTAVGYRYDMPSDLRAPAQSSRSPGFESDTPAAQSWAEIEEGLDRSWTKADDLVGRYDAFCALDDTARAAWLSWAVARTLHAVPAGGSGAALLDHIGSKIDIDMPAWWRPTARRYFDRISKPMILEHFEEVGGAELRSRYSASKKHDLALSAEKLFTGQIIVEAEVKERALLWLPDAMTFGHRAEEAANLDIVDDEDGDDGTSDEPSVAEDGADIPEAA